MLSIIVPVYNSEKHLRQCLDSIVNQSYKDYQLILVDDGSEDQSVDICKSYCAKYANVKLIEGMHKGPFSARKAGVDAAEGNYITFADSDDFISKEAYAKAEFAMGKNIDVISFDIYRFFDENNIKYDACGFEEKIYCKDEIRNTIFPCMIWNEKMNRYGIDPGLCNKIFKADIVKTVYKKTEMIDFQYGEDTAITYPILALARSIAISHTAYYYHRQRPRGILAPYIADKDFLGKLYKLYVLLSDSMSGDTCFQRQIDLFYEESVRFQKWKYGIVDPPVNEIFPFDKIRQGEKVIIYGGGPVGTLYIRQLSQLDYCEVVLWVDQNYKELGNGTQSPDLIAGTEFDHLVIAVANMRTKEQIHRYLLDCGIPDYKIVR